MSRTNVVADLRQDLIHAVRVLWRGRGFTAVAVATLALGIGASTAIFTVIHSVLLRPLPFPEPHELAMIRPSSGSRVSAAYLDEWRRQGAAFEDLAGWQDARATLTGAGDPLEVLVDRATANFFVLLRTPALLGRTFSVDADLSHVEREIVLSHGFWARRYGNDPRALGQSITLDGEAFEIIGIMPEGFTIRTTELAESRAELWMPFPLVQGNPAGMGGFLNVVARLAPGVTVHQARSELALIARRIEQQHPSYSRDWTVDVVPLLDATVRDVRPTLLVLSGAVAILLLIACANVANLTSSRGIVRQGEFAIRLSLGATRWRLARQLLTEGLVLAAIGGACGVLLAKWGLDLLMLAIPPGLDLPRAGNIDVDLRALVFAGAVTLLASLLSGLVPALASSRSSHAGVRSAQRAASASPRLKYIGSTLIVCEVALALILLVGAGLVGRSFWELTRVDPGFEPERVLTARTTLSASRYDTDERVRTFTSELLTRLHGIDGVRSAGFADYLPMSRFGAGGPFEIEGRPPPRPGEPRGSWVSLVGGRYFEAMGIPLLRGRLPRAADTENSTPVFVIDEELARRYWPDADPIGARLTWRRAGERFSGDVIGVVGSVRWGGLASIPPATTYWWHPQAPGRELTIVARTAGDPEALAARISTLVREIDPHQPVANIRTMEDFVSDDLARPRFTMFLLAGFAGAALVLAATGLFGVIAFWVTQRTREIGVRLALGAQSRDIVQLVMRRAMFLLAAGLAAGIAIALALGRVLTSVIYGVRPSDPSTLAAVTLFLAAIAMLAAYLPARRATRVDPLLAVKAE